MKKFKLFLVSSLVLAFVATSCYKKKDTIAKVTVTDASGSVVGGADVRLYYEGNNAPRENLDQTVSTDGSGVATFNYNEFYKAGQAGFAILDIDVNGITKVGIIRIEEETTSEATVTI